MWLILRPVAPGTRPAAPGTALFVPSVDESLSSKGPLPCLW